MKLLLISDEESPALWEHYRPEHLAGVDMILSAGDLRAEYLSFLVTMANRPLLYIPGNHDGAYMKAPPEGCECVDDRLVTVNGLRILGLGGCLKYNNGPYQYTEWQMRRRVLRLWPRLTYAGGVDIVLTHAPVRGHGDMENVTHRGFEAFLPLLDTFRPKYLIHGHVHLRYQPCQGRIQHYGGTTIINASEKYFLEIDPEHMREERK